jgi:hypothetical protein
MVKALLMVMVPLAVFQQNLAANDVHHHKAATRLVAVDVADDRMLFVMLFHSHYVMLSPAQMDL